VSLLCSRAEPRALVGSRAFIRSGFALCLLLVGACADSTTELHVPTPDVLTFAANVYPVLLRDCGFPECHGNPERFFHIYGPGRTRTKPKEELLFSAPPLGEELTATYRRAQSMLAYEGTDVGSALLLNKPLHGAHEGHDEWGNNVYQSANDPGYQTLLAWALSASRSAPPAAAQADAGAR
jgi:hypothetical protein